MNIFRSRFFTLFSLLAVTLIVFTATAMVSTAEAVSPPERPQSLIASDITATTLTLSWADPDDATITGYKILSREKGPTNEFATLVANTGNANTSYEVTGLKPETSYIFRIYAINEAGESTLPSKPARITTEVQSILTPSTSDFVTTWKTTTSNESITIPVGGTTGVYNVDWGDGTESLSVTGNQTHTYTNPGKYTVRISGDFTRINLDSDYSNADKLVSIDQWGNIQWSNMHGAFAWADNMYYNATDAPDLSGVTDMSRMFYKAQHFNGNLSSWDTSTIASMSQTFYGTQSFTGDISTWDVSNVKKMKEMFYRSLFNGDISGWNTSSVGDMAGMFTASSFNGDLSEWDVSNVYGMGYMFYGTPFNGDLSEWDVSNVINMEYMFKNARHFNSDISGWDVSNVNNFTKMFQGATSFNSDISRWNVNPAAYSAFHIPYEATAFDQNMGNLYIKLTSSTVDKSSGSRHMGVVLPFHIGYTDRFTYDIGTGHDSEEFWIIPVGPDNRLYMCHWCVSPGIYTVNITAVGGYGADVHHRLVDITVTGSSPPPPPPPPADFVTTWRTTAPNESITIPVGNATGTYNIDWGDNSTSTDVTGDQTHTYTHAGDYKVRISGDFTRLYVGGDDITNIQKLVSIDQWGEIQWCEVPDDNS